MTKPGLILTGALMLLSGLLTGCFHDAGTPTPDQPPTDDVLNVTQTAPDRATIEQPFTMSVTVRTTKAIPAISVRADIDGLTLVDKGDFLNVEGNVLSGVVIQPAANEEQTFEFEAKCTDPIEYSVTAIVQSKDVTPVWQTSRIPCAE